MLFRSLYSKTGKPWNAEYDTAEKAHAALSAYWVQTQEELVETPAKEAVKAQENVSLTERDVESKKADIERRRREELNKVDKQSGQLLKEAAPSQNGLG